MECVLTMGGKSYLCVYPGTAEEASKAALEDLVTLEDGSFTLPVDALDAGYTCAAFSAKKQEWYPRTLLFRADSLPLEAWKSLTTAGSLGPDPGSMAFCERNNNNKKAVYYLKLNRTWALLREEE